MKLIDDRYRLAVQFGITIGFLLPIIAEHIIISIEWCYPMGYFFLGRLFQKVPQKISTPWGKYTPFFVMLSFRIFPNLETANQTWGGGKKRQKCIQRCERTKHRFFLKIIHHLIYFTPSYYSFNS